ncbi:MAG: hypothetical protein IJQ38_05155 [Bacteroidaceae bacterium]|nr:hypothetical protein [Bacteroidaceae bacterium]
MKRSVLLLLCCLAMTAATARRRKLPEPHIPMLAWTSIPPGEYATLEHYQELRDAGFDYSLSWTGSLEEVLRTMDLAAQVTLIRRDGTSAPAHAYGPLHILSPGDCAIFELPT